MNKTRSKAEVFLMALQALSRSERKAVASGLLDDPQLRDDVLDLALIRQRRDEPSRPFRDYLVERKRGVRPK